MNCLRKFLTFPVLAVLMGIVPVIEAAAPLVELDLSASDIVVNCTAPAAERTYSFVATWHDPTAAGGFTVKNGSACRLVADSLGPVNPAQQCTTNARVGFSCEPRCTKGECRAEFVGCVLGRGPYLYVLAKDGSGYDTIKFTYPACN